MGMKLRISDRDEELTVEDRRTPFSRVGVICRAWICRQAAIELSSQPGNALSSIEGYGLA